MVYLWWVAYAIIWVTIAFGLLLVAKKLFDRLTPYSLDVQLTDKDNPAVGLVLTGFLLGIVAIIAGVFSGGGAAEEFSAALLGQDVVAVLSYAIPGMVLLFFAGVVTDKVVLHRFCIHQEIVEHRNMAVAAVVASIYLSSGLIVAGGIVGSFSLFSALMAYLIGQVGLVLFAFLYQKLTSYDDLKELGERKNKAAGVAFAGNLFAYGLILMKGVSMSGGGLVETPVDRLTHFFYYAIVGCILLVVIRSVTDRVFLPKEKLSKEIVEDQNLCAGLIEAGLAVASGIILIVCL